MCRRHNTNSIAVNMNLTMLYVTSKYGLRNKIQTLFLIIQFISDSTTANAKKNFVLNLRIFLHFDEDCW
jgi:hypothetical protein